MDEKSIFFVKIGKILVNKEKKEKKVRGNTNRVRDRIATWPSLFGNNFGFGWRHADMMKKHIIQSTANDCKNLWVEGYPDKELNELHERWNKVITYKF